MRVKIPLGETATTWLDEVADADGLTPSQWAHRQFREQAVVPNATSLRVLEARGAIPLSDGRTLVWSEVPVEQFRITEAKEGDVGVEVLLGKFLVDRLPPSAAYVWYSRTPTERKDLTWNDFSGWAASFLTERIGFAKAQMENKDAESEEKDIFEKEAKGRAKPATPPK